MSEVTELPIESIRDNESMYSYMYRYTNHPNVEEIKWKTLDFSTPAHSYESQRAHFQKTWQKDI